MNPLSFEDVKALVTPKFKVRVDVWDWVEDAEGDVQKEDCQIYSGFFLDEKEAIRDFERKIEQLRTEPYGGSVGIWVDKNCILFEEVKPIAEMPLFEGTNEALNKLTIYPNN